MMSKVMIANRLLKRTKYLGSASIIAAATALVAVASADNAQAQSRITGPRVHSPAPGILPMRHSAEQQAPRQAPRLSDPRGVSVPRVLRENLPDNLVILPNAPVNRLAPPTPLQISVTTAPSSPSVSIASPPPIVINSQSTGPVFAPATVNGVSVQAIAEFDNTQIGFTPGVAGDVVNVLASSAIIDWRTFTSGAANTDVTFLGAGDNLDFTSGLSDYTVLNRIFTPNFDSAVRIDGNVSSTIFGGQAPGGNIWFYSPGGLIIGAGASFNVGSLLLSTSVIDPSDVAAGDLNVDFTGVSDTDSFIRIEETATITANNPNSYVAMIAPRIEQGGSVRTNGSTAYVAAEEATMTIQNGLFDISVDVGSGHSSGDGIVHTGSTGGEGSTGQFDEQAIYFVSVPKNTAINMLVGGSVGYDAAVSASVDNGQIILTTGNRVERVDSTTRVSNGMGGTVSVPISSNTVDTSVDGGGAGSITLENLRITSFTDVFAEDTITVRAGVSSATDSIIVAGNGGDVIDLGLTAGNAVNVQVAGEGVIDVSGSLNITAGDGAGNGGDVTINLAQDPSLTTPTGGLFTGLNLNIDTSASGLDDFFIVRNNGGTGIGQDAIAGQVSLDISNGATLATGSSINIDASAQGGKGEQQNGSATAGNITLNLASGSILSGGISIDTRAISAQAGKIGGNGSGSIGANGAAGDVTINLLGGSSDLGNVSVQSTADASFGTDETTAQSQDAFGSDFTLNVSGGDHAMNALSIFSQVSAREAYDGTSNGSRPGQASRATATIALTNSGTSLNIAGNLIFDGGASGDVAASPSNAVNISVIDTDSATGGGLNIGEELSIFTGVDVGSPGGVSTAGSVFLAANNGTFDVDRLTIDADADPFFFTNTDISGSDFQGGDVSITANNGGVFTVASGTEINSEGVGFIASNGSGTGVGQGGTITVLADDGSINMGGTSTFGASGFASAAFNGGQAPGQGLGGTVRITVQGADGSLAFDDLEAGTDGSFAQDFSEEFIGSDGEGSRGSGGLTEFNILGGAFSANNVTVSSIGEGGQAGESVSSSGSNPLNDKGRTAAVSNGLPSAERGGDGIGGDVVFNLDGGTASMANLTISASGIGGAGGEGSTFLTTPQNGGAGGDAVGGTATFNGTSGSLTVAGTLTVEANGNEQFFGSTSGGNGGSGFGTGGGDGGAATGGTATFNMDGSATVDAAAIVVSTRGFGGNGGDSSANFSGDPDQGGGDGGNSSGGLASFNDTSGNLTFGSLTVDSSGVGGDGGSSFGNTTGDAQGDGGAGGDGTGGTALIALNQDNADPRDFSLLSLGNGGQGGSGANGGAGGTGQGGDAELAVNNSDVALGLLTIDTSANGGQTGFADGLIVADGADGGGAIGGTSTLRVAGVDAVFTANNLIQITAGATGAAGGDGSFGPNDAEPGGDGGAGGSASGGTASIVVADGAVYQLDADTINLASDATGGQGGNGGGNFVGGGSGNGGDGGDATGGISAIVATSGADLTLQSFSVPFFISSSGNGGDGGAGGGIDMVSGGIAGAGGDGGNGTGGSPTLSATGATITGDEVELFGQGFGGAGGLGGEDGTVTIGPDGDGGIGAGGAPLIEVVEGSPGIITLGNVTISATGAGGTGTVIGLGDGGQVTIRDLSPDPAGLITFGALTVDATGDPTATGGRLTFESASGPITVNGNLNADVAGDIVFTMDGTGQVAVTGATVLNATQDIIGTHANNGAGNATIDTDATINAFTAVTGRDFLFGAGTFVDAVGAVVITGQNVAYNDIASTRTVDVTATTGSITGTATGTITGSNVLDAIDLLAADDVTFGILNTVDGDPVTRDGNIDIDAGGNITGVSAISGQFINMDAGGLVSVGTVDTLETSTGTVTINAGAIDLGTLDARFISNLTTTTGDLEIDTINGLTDLSLDSAAAIILGTAATGDFTATAATDVTIGSLSAGGAFDVDAGGAIAFDDAAAVGALTLTGNSVDGNAVSSSGAQIVIIATEEVNLVSFEASANSSITGGSVSLGDSDVGLSLTIDSTDGDIVSDGTLRASNLTFRAVGGDVDLATTNTISTTNITADGAIAFDSVTASNVTANAGTDLTAQSIIATSSFGASITLTADDQLTVNNAQAPGALILDAASINANNLDIGFIQAVATGAITLDNLSATANSTITGGSVSLNDVANDLSYTVTSTVGNISSTGTLAASNLVLDSAVDIILGDATTTSTMRFDALGAISFGSLTGSSLALDAGTTLIGDALTSTTGFGSLFGINLTAGTLIDVNELSAPSAVQLIAPTADIDVLDATSLFTTISGLLDLGSATLTSNNTITAGSLILGDVTNDLTLTLVATTGDIVSSGTIDAGNLNADGANIDLATVQTGIANITAVNNASIAELNTTGIAGTATLEGASVNIDSGDVAVNLNVTSTTGDITGSGAITVGGTANFDAAQNIAIGSLEATNVDLTSGGDILFNAITSPNDIALTAAMGQIGTNAPGLGDITSGGGVDLTALTMALGDITATGTGSITANATGGDASFGDLNSDTTIAITAAGTPSVESVTSGGDTTITGVSIGLDGGDVGGSLILDATAGDIDIALDGTDQLLVGANATFNAAGDMNVTHSNNTGDQASILVQGGNFNANLGGNFTSGAGSIISSAGEMLIFADGNIDASDLRAGPAIDLLAGGNVTVGDLTATGPQGVSNFNGIAIAAGFQDFGSTFGFDPAANVLINGVVTSYTDVIIDAGGTVTFAGGSSTNAADAITVTTGDDIIVEQGALLNSATNPSSLASPTLATPGTADITLNAGSLANLLSTPLTPIASIVIDGSLNSNLGSISLNANAIEALDGDLSGVSLTADVRDAPASSAFLSDDGGLLSTPCLEGIVCLGDMDFSDQIAIGQASNNDVIRLFIEQAIVNATDIFITTREDIVMGTTGIDTTLNASNTFSATSNTGNVDLRDAAISANQILIDAAGSLIGSAALTSTNDIGISVSDSIAASSIVTDGELTTVADIGGALEGQYSVPGGFSVGLLSQGASDIDITAGGDIDVGEAVSPGDVTLSADGDVFLGIADAPGAISLSGQSAGFDALTATNGISIDALSGSISGSGELITTGAGADIALTAAQDIAIQNATSQGGIGLDADGDITFDELDAQGGGFTANAGRSIDFNAASATGIVDFSANDGVTGTSLSSDAAVLIDTGTGGVDIAALTAADADVFAVDGAVNIDDAIVAGQLVAEGSEVTVGSSTGLNIDAVASAGNVDVQAAGDLEAIADAAGDLALVSLGGNATITGGTGQNIALSAAGDLDVAGDVIAGADLTMDAGGTFILGGDAIGETITVNSADVAVTSDGQLGDATLTNLVTFNASDEVFLGGAGGSGAAYEIDNDEFARIHSGGDIVVSVFGSGSGGSGGPVVIGGGLITVDTLDITAGDGSNATGQNIGQSGGLVLQSEGDIAVIGNATISNATLDTLFIAEASNLVRINTETGGIFITDANGGLGGVIEITATDFNAVTDSAFADIQGMSLADIDARLGNSDGVDRPDGVIRADTLDIDTTASQVFIQNTATGTDFADRRGFDVNRLFISDSGGTTQPIVINGLIGGVAGIDTIPLADITSTINTASTINGCLIFDTGACLPIIVDPIDPIDHAPPTDPSRDVIEEGLDPQDTTEASGTIQTGMLEFSPDFEFGTEPLIDEPVTGAGNEDLWVDPDCPPGANPEVCAAEPAE